MGTRGRLYPDVYIHGKKYSSGIYVFDEQTIKKLINNIQEEIGDDIDVDLSVLSIVFVVDGKEVGKIGSNSSSNMMNNPKMKTIQATVNKRMDQYSKLEVRFTK